MLVLLLYGGLLGLTYWGFTQTPTGFIPSQDKGYLLVNVQLPDSSSLERTQKVMAQVERLALDLPGVSHTLAIAGQSILMNANAPNFGAMYVMLDEFHHRAHDGLTGRVIAARLESALQEEIKDGLVNVFEAPPVDGLGTAGGFKIVVEDRGDLGSQEIERRRQQHRRRRPGAALRTVPLRTVHQLPGEYPLALPGYRPRQGQAGGGLDRRAVQHLAGLPGFALHQRLQPLRPHLAGQRPGRRQLPQADQRPDRAASAQRDRRDGADRQHRRRFATSAAR